MAMAGPAVRMSASGWKGPLFATRAMSQKCQEYEPARAKERCAPGGVRSDLR
jgi:hypothetical protein